MLKGFWGMFHGFRRILPTIFVLAVNIYWDNFVLQRCPLTIVQMAMLAAHCCGSLRSHFLVGAHVETCPGDLSMRVVCDRKRLGGEWCNRIVPAFLLWLCLIVSAHYAEGKGKVAKLKPKAPRSSVMLARNSGSNWLQLIARGLVDAGHLGLGSIGLIAAPDLILKLWFEAAPMFPITSVLLAQKVESVTCAMQTYWRYSAKTCISSRDSFLRSQVLL